jgi:hypothetical protein
VTSIVQDGDTNKEELKPLSKEDAVKSIRQFKEDLGIANIHTDEERLQDVLKKIGPLSEEVNKMRHDQDM